MKNILYICMIMDMLFSCLLFACDKTQSNNKKNTVMVYMVGSDLESEKGAATKDILEMMESGLDVDTTNLLIYTGGTRMWHAGISSEKNSTYLLTSDKESDDKRLQMKLLHITNENMNMGESQTLSEFLNYSYKNYPADHYGLIMWDHGSGPIRGFGSDENYANDSLSIAELDKAFSASVFSDNKLDWIGFDACMMATVEIANSLCKYARYMVASQESVPGYGWDYTFLSKLDEVYEPIDVCKTIIDSYMNFYDNKKSAVFDPEITMSCVDLSMLNDLTSSIDELFKHLNKSLKDGYYSDIARRRKGFRNFGEASANSKGNTYNLIDIGEFAEREKEIFPEQGEAVLSIIHNIIKYEKSNINLSSGLSLYYPSDSPDSLLSVNDIEHDGLNKASNYKSFIKTFSDKIKKIDEEDGKAVSQKKIETQNITDDNDEIIIKLSKKQQEKFSKAYYHILKEKDDEYEDSCMPLLMYVDVEPDENGVIKIQKKQKIPIISNGNDSMPIPMRQYYSSNEMKNYKTIYSVASNYEDDPMFTDEGDQVTLLCKSLDGIDLDIVQAMYNDRYVDIGKKTVEPGSIELFTSLNSYLKRIDGRDGCELPFQEWHTAGRIIGWSCDITDDVKICMRDIESSDECEEGRYYIQVVVEDVDGKKYATSISEICSKRKKLREVKTEKGKFTYEMHSDYASIEKYEGDDKKLVIPESLDGLPVTYIGNVFKNDSLEELEIKNPNTIFDISNSSIKRINLPNGMVRINSGAFSYNANLEYINIPETVEYIGKQAFYNCRSLKKILIPASVKKIDNGAFSCCAFPDGFVIEDGNRNYKIEGQNLLSYDGKKLFARFDMGCRFCVPDGVEEIKPLACEGTEFNIEGENYKTTVDNTITKVVFSKTLKKIDHSAFRGSHIDEIMLPDGLEEIGDKAFASTDIFAREYDAHGNNYDNVIKKIRIGKKVQNFGKSVLGKQIVKEYEVDPQNTFFTVKDGRLKDKSSDIYIGLTAHDDWEENKDDYILYKYLEKYIDYSKYSDSDDEKYSKTYYNEAFCTSMEKKKSDVYDGKNKLAHNVVFSEKKFKLPCKVKNILSRGYHFCNSRIKPETLITPENGIIELLQDDNGDVLGAAMDNIDKGKKRRINNCIIKSINIEKEYMSQFRVCGIEEDYDIKKTLKKLGTPDEISISNGIIRFNYNKSLQFDGDKYNDLEITFSYDIDSGEDEIFSIYWYMN